VGFTVLKIYDFEAKEGGPWYIGELSDGNEY
jgi:hypothetical protein